MDNMIDPLNLVNEVGRVRLAADGAERLSLEVRAKIAGRIRWLRAELDRLDDVLKLTYPPIRVYPVCWVCAKPTGPVHAITRPVLRQPGRWYLGVDLSAASLLAFSDEIVRGILAHEFRHYAHQTLMIHAAVLAGKRSLDYGGTRQPHTFTEYRHLEPETQVPEHWLGEQLAALARRAELSTDAEVMSGLAWLKTEWADRGYPVEMLNRDSVTDGHITLDTSVVERAAEDERRTTEDTRL